MKVFVCGSIGYGYKEEIARIQDVLRSEGFNVIDQLKYDYSHVDDFRENFELCREIVEKDLDLCDQADAIVLIATYPSFGAMAEVVISAMRGKPVLVYSPGSLKSPWPVYFAKRVVRDERELISALMDLRGKEIRTIPNVYCNHESEIIYDKFTCICPVTGRRDFAKIKIRYKPNDRILEYESLDTYFRSFRDMRMHHEDVVCKIFRDLWKSLEPKSLEVIAEFEERSCVKAIVKKYDCHYELLK